MRRELGRPWKRRSELGWQLRSGRSHYCAGMRAVGQGIGSWSGS